MKAVTGKLTASKDRHVGLSLLVAAALAFFGCDSGVSNPSDNESSSSAGSLTESSSSLAPSSSSEEVSSSSSLEEKYSYCVFIEHQICLSGSFASCEAGGLLSNTCPYNNNGSSSSEILPSSSSEEISSSSSTSSLTESSSSLVSSSSEILPSSSSEVIPSSSSSVGSLTESSSSLVPSSSSIEPSSSSIVPSSSSIALSSSSVEPSSSSQQVVISPPVNAIFFDDFEGTDEWTVVSSTGANYWMVGSGTSYSGSRSAYITNNGSDNAYTTGSASTSNIYREITFPSENPGFTISFYWKANGQMVGESSYDYMTVYLVPSSENITNAMPSISYKIGHFYRNISSWEQASINLGSAYSGGTYNLVFRWQNDNSGGSQTPGAIDYVSIVTYTPPPPADIRDYRTVTIGEQVWMAENLNWNAPSSECYDDLETNCDKYGRLYNWTTAMALPSSCNDILCGSQIQAKHQGICPSGWHLPSDEDWNTLRTYVQSAQECSNCDAKHLKATSSWKSGSRLDTYGFTALPGGYYSSYNGYFANVGLNGYWWRTSESSASSSNYIMMESSYEYRVTGSSNKPDYRSVRCLKD